MTKFSVVMATLGVAAGVVAGCGDSGAPSAGPAETTTAAETTTVAETPTAAETTATSVAPVPGGATITISGNNYGEPITVPPGAQITVVNDDAAEHTVTSEPAGKFDVHVDGQAQQVFTAPTEPGEYPFICTYHPGMTGTLTVS